MEAVNIWNTTLYPQTWRWRQQAPPKHRLFTNRHGVIPHNSWIFLNTSMRNGGTGDRIPVGGGDILRLYRPALGPTQPPVQWVPGLLPEGKAARKWPWPPTPHLGPRQKKTSTSPLVRHGLFFGEFCLYLLPLRATPILPVPNSPAFLGSS